MSKEPNRNIYVGHRYVPKIMGEWDSKTDYEGLSIVTYQGTSYTSKKRVPVGIDILNGEFWVVTGNYNAQVDHYRDETQRVAQDLLLKANQTYVDSELQTLKNDINNNEVSVLDYGALGDGDKDNTLEIQECFNNETNVYFPDGIYMTNDIDVPSNINIRLSKNAYVVKIPTSETSYDIFNLRDVKNVIISGGYIKGDRVEHVGTSGEWGMGISLRGTTNVKIYDTEIIDCWGDGIYVGVSDNQDHCKDTIIDNVRCDNNRRQGISIISVINLKLNNVKCSNTSGTEPADGIDIEPNNNLEHLENIVINNLTTENNDGAGITIFLGRFGDTPNKMNITINNHHDNGSNFGFRIIASNSKNIDGVININKPVWKGNNGIVMYIDRHDITNGFINIVDPVIYSNSSTTIPFNISHSLATTKDNPVHGNISLIRPKLIIEKDTTPPPRMIILSQGTANKLKDVSIIDPQILGNAGNMSTFILSATNTVENLNYSDKYKVSVIHTDDGAGYPTLRFNPYYSKLKYNNGASVVINETVPIGLPFTIVNNSGNFTALQFSGEAPTPVYYYPLGSPGTEGAQYISNSNKGAEITFVKLSENEIQILNMIGDWKFSPTQE